MKLRFNKAVFYTGRTKYGYALPVPRQTTPQPGEGTKRRILREAELDKLNREKYGW